MTFLVLAAFTLAYEKIETKNKRISHEFMAECMEMLRVLVKDVHVKGCSVNLGYGSSC
jgi:hypothetical protein